MQAVVTNQSKEFYELVTWVVVIGINVIMFAFAYWLADIALLMQKPVRKYCTLALALLTAGVGFWRMIAIVIYYDDFVVQLAIPVSAAITWAIIFVIGFVGHRYLRNVSERILARQENIDLTNAVQDEIIQPMLRGEKIPMSLIRKHQNASIAFAGRVK